MAANSKNDRGLLLQQMIYTIAMSEPQKPLDRATSQEM